MSFVQWLLAALQIASRRLFLLAWLWWLLRILGGKEL